MTFWSRLTRSTEHSGPSYEEAQRWALRNAIFLLVAAMAAAAVLGFAALGAAAEVLLASAAFTISTLIGFVMSRAGHRRSAALCTVAALNAAIFYNTQNFGPGVFECAHIVSIGLAFLTLERRDTVSIAAALALTLGTLGLGTVTWWPTITTLDAGQAAGLRLTTVTLVLANISIILMYFLVHRDRTIAKLHQVAREAEAASEATSRVLANMSHELRTPLNGVLGVLDILGDTALSHEQLDHVHSARTAGRSLLGIIDDILDLARVEAGMVVLAPAPFDLRAVVEEVVRQTAIQVHDRSVSVTADYPDQVPAHVVGDAKRVRQVLVNLLGNAAKFTASGEIVVWVACEPGEAGAAVFSLAVSDTGVGIPRDSMARIFEKFQQVDDSMTRNHGGTGLGLTIVKELVTRMQGTVDVDSEPGRGSRFCVRLPLHLATQSEVAPAATPFAPGTNRARAQPHVLVVEDNLVNQKVAVHRLQRLGCRVDVAGDGNEALARIEQTAYAVVFMDVQMPGMDGLATTRAIRLRERASGGHVRIVAMTAHAYADDRARCLEAGMDDHVSKPVIPDALQAVLHRHLAQP